MASWLLRLSVKLGIMFSLTLYLDDLAANGLNGRLSGLAKHDGKIFELEPIMSLSQNVNPI